MNINWVNSKSQIVTLNGGKNLKSQSATISKTSLKDLGKKWFAFSKMDKSGLKVMERIKKFEV